MQDGGGSSACIRKTWAPCCRLCGAHASPAQKWSSTSWVIAARDGATALHDLYRTAVTPYPLGVHSRDCHRAEVCYGLVACRVHVLSQVKIAHLRILKRSKRKHNESSVSTSRGATLTDRRNQLSVRYRRLVISCEMLACGQSDRSCSQDCSDKT
jgi:hypothetical protein